jgi:anti-sigma regulatory factor (Ser/Thr protein kinase)
MGTAPSSLTETYDAEPGAVARARAALGAFAAAAGASTVQVDSVRLAVSEAVTNAVVHGYRGGPGAVQVGAALSSGELWIRVADDGCGMRAHADRAGLGLGLVLMAQVSDHMSIVPGVRGGTEVRIRFDLGSTRQADAAAVAEPVIALPSLGNVTAAVAAPSSS